MMASIAPPERQPSLFESLPATEPRRRRARSRPQPLEETVVTTEPERAESPQTPFQTPPAPPVAMRLDAAALTRPDLCDLVRDLAEPSLGFLLVEAAREVKRRLVSDEPEESDSPPEPNPQLLRAIRSTVTELAEGEQ